MDCAAAKENQRAAYRSRAHRVDDDADGQTGHRIRRISQKNHIAVS